MEQAIAQCGIYDGVYELTLYSRPSVHQLDDEHETLGVFHVTRGRTHVCWVKAITYRGRWGVQYDRKELPDWRDDDDAAGEEPMRPRG